jgi:enoyl-[acyl-carrier-protein] reductase (NADH)
MAALVMRPRCAPSGCDRRQLAGASGPPALLDHLDQIPVQFGAAHLQHAEGGVRINAVAPGLVATPWTEQWHERKAGVEQIAQLHRVGTPEDIAEACAAIATTRYITGQTLVVDGGLGLTI